MTGARSTPADVLEIDVSVLRRSFDVTARLRLEPGEKLSLFGPSGAGKTTLLETIAGLVRPTTGAVRLGAKVLSREPGRPRRSGRLLERVAPGGPTPAAVGDVALVRQPTMLFPHLDVAENVAYGASEPALVSEMIDRLELGPLASAKPSALSGGQAQRVAVARALARRSRVILLDEPFSAVDARTRADCWEVVRDKAEREGAIVVLVTHDLHEAQALGDHMALISEGEIVALGDPHEVVADPGSRKAAEMVGYGSFLALSRLTPGGGGPEEIELAIDPQRVLLGAHSELGAVFKGNTITCRPMGSRFGVIVSVQQRSPVTTTFGGEWVTAVTCDLSFVVDGPVTMGNEILATALKPPVVASSALGGGFRRQPSDRSQTAI